MRRAAAALTVALAFSSQPAGAQDPALDQTIERDQTVASGTATLSDGHVDIGPSLVDGELNLLIHDDSVVPAVWRRLDDTVIAVGDDAVQIVPDDPAYDFLGVGPGTPVHVVPQVQQPGVVWVGWNTQDPAVMEQIDRGATLTLLGAQGPGDLVMYLQSGTLGSPDVLWRSASSARQPVWVEVNTHTHANWVFTRPGVYLVRVRIEADLVDGTTVSDTRDLRFAVGSAAKPADALAASWSGPEPAADDTASSGEDAAAAGGDDDGGTGSLVVVLAIVGVTVALGGTLAATVARERRAKRDARDETAEDAA